MRRREQIWRRFRNPYSGGWYDYLGPRCVFEVRDGALRRVTNPKVMSNVQAVVEGQLSANWLWNRARS